MLKRFKATLYGTAGLLAGGVLTYFGFFAFAVPKSTAFFFSVALSAYCVPFIGAFALVAIRPVGEGKSPPQNPLTQPFDCVEDSCDLGAIRGRAQLAMRFRVRPSPARFANARPPSFGG